MRRYNERHDAVLAVITNFVKSNIPQGYGVLSDLPESQPYTLPPHIAATDQRPDLVVWNNEMKEVWVVELTICFENRFDETNLLKAGRYADLMQQVTTSNYSGTLLTLEVGSRGFLSLSNFTKLQHELLVCKKSAWRGFMMEVVRTVIKGSQKIWATRKKVLET